MRRIRLRMAVGVLAVALVATLAAAATAARTTAADRTTLTFLTSGFNPDLDPDGANSFFTGMLRWHTYDRLVAYPEKLVKGAWVPNYKVTPLKFQPDLATSYTNKGLSWTFKLRKGVKSCAGHELTADDVVYTVNRALTRSGAVSNGSYNIWSKGSILPLVAPKPDPNAQLSGQVAKVDANTVRFTQLTANVEFPRILADVFGFIFDSKEMKAHATADDPWSHKWLSSGHVAGYGPYCMNDPPSGNEARLTANANYWGPKPQYKTVILRYVPTDAARMQALQAGAADGAQDLSPAEYASLGKSVAVYSVPNTFAISLMMNFNVEPWGFKNLKLRAAVAAALPYDTFLGGPVKGATQRWAGLVPSTYYGFRAFTPLKQNVALAKQLMAQAGFPNGKGLEQYTDGLTMYYDAEANGAYAPELANQVRSALAQIGINIQIQGLPDAVYNQRQYVLHNLPMALQIGNMGNLPDAAAGMQLFYATPANGGSVNFTGYVNADLDRNVLAALGSSSVKAYLKGVNEAQRILYRDRPMIPIVELYQQMAFRKGITGWEVTPVGYPTFMRLKSTS